MTRTDTRWIFVMVLSLWAAAPALRGQEATAPAQTTAAPAQKSAAALRKPQIAAMVNGDPIYVGEIDANLGDVLKQRRADGQRPEVAKAELLRDIINKRLIEQAIDREGGYIDKAAVDQQLDKLRNTLKDKRTTLEEYAAKQGVGPDVARHEIVWAMTWNKYLEQNLADLLEAYFNDHRKELDGTQVRASHILLRRESASETNEQLIARAEKIRQEIEAKKLTFEQAAEKYSAGPSRQHGGDLGFLPRHGVMDEQFAKAAFAIEKDEISKPVVTHFGVHLIRETDVKPGSKQWTEVVNDIKVLAARDLFDRMAIAERAKAKIEYTGKSPYFKPGSNEVVVGSSASENDDTRRATK